MACGSLGGGRWAGLFFELLIDPLRTLYGNVANAIILAFRATFLTFHRVDVLQAFEARAVSFWTTQDVLWEGYIWHNPNNVGAIGIALAL